ncbi:MAG: hypothetical protein PHD21_02840 [Flavobacteriales bacterium]|nr:hypothetical protein [Flavobacteriales bacterium]
MSFEKTFNYKKTEIKICDSILHISKNSIPVNEIASIEVYKIKGILPVYPVVFLCICLIFIFLEWYALSLLFLALFGFLAYKTKDHFSIVVIDNDNKVYKCYDEISGDIKSVSLLKDDIVSGVFHSFS